MLPENDLRLVAGDCNVVLLDVVSRSSIQDPKGWRGLRLLPVF